MVCLTHIWSFLLSLWDIKGYRMISTSLMETAILILYNILPLILFESMASALCSFSLHISACLSFLTCNPGMLKLTASHRGRACLRQDLSLFYIHGSLALLPLHTATMGPCSSTTGGWKHWEISCLLHVWKKKTWMVWPHECNCVLNVCFMNPVCISCYLNPFKIYAVTIKKKKTTWFLWALHEGQLPSWLRARRAGWMTSLLSLLWATMWQPSSWLRAGQVT